MGNYTFRGTQKNGAKKLRNKSYTIGKGNIILDFFTSEKGLDTIENPQNNHTIGDQGDSKNEINKKMANDIRKGQEKKKTQKKVGHNRGPRDQSYYY